MQIQVVLDVPSVINLNTSSSIEETIVLKVRPVTPTIHVSIENNFLPPRQPPAASDKSLTTFSGIMLTIILPFLDALNRNYFYACVPLHFLDNGWPLLELSALFFASKVGGCPASAYIMKQGDKACVHLFLLSTMASARMAWQPGDKSAVCVGIFVHCVCSKGSLILLDARIFIIKFPRSGLMWKTLLISTYDIRQPSLPWSHSKTLWAFPRSSSGSPECFHL
jgi:hypothetical protein